MTTQQGSLFAVPHVRRVDRPDGSVLLTSTDPVRRHPTTLVHSLREWAERDPDHPLVAERSGEGWTTVSYGDAVRRAAAIGQGLLERGLGPDRPLMILSGNSVAHLLLTLGAMTAKVPVAPISVAYSLQSQDHDRIRQMADLLNPGAVFAEAPGPFSKSLAAIPDVPAVNITDLASTGPGAEVEGAFASLGGEDVAKFLFTSGSTGSPKGVVTTHGMLAVNQQMMREVWPFLEEERPVIVDWLPWSHTFGGSHNVGMVANGGTLYVDEGRPAPGLFDKSLANLRDVHPTIYFNVPAGYAQLIPALESDSELAELFFSRLRLLFNAAAALPSTLRERLVEVARRTTGRDIPVTGSWGLTETAPATTNAHFPFTDARSIGVPLPGAELLLVPSEDAFEIRVRWPMVTPGYAARPDLTADSFDQDGFYKTGDAVDFADPDRLDLGLVFRGRIAEDFKLSTGTFVRVGALRTSLLSVAPALSDAVIVGEDGDCACALAWLNPAEVKKALGRDAAVSDGEYVVDDDLAKHLAGCLDQLAAGTGSAGHVERLLVMTRPASLDIGEITDKGYVNQRQVAHTRANLVERLYAAPVQLGVITRANSD